MKRRSVWGGALAVAALTAGLLVPGTQAAQAGTWATCGVQPGSVLADGSHVNGGITIGYPPMTIGRPGVTPDVFPPGAVRLSTTFKSEPYSAGATNEGFVGEGDSLYYRQYSIDTMSRLDADRPDVTQRVGGGWANFTAVETSEFFASASSARKTAYGLRSDGTLFRWSYDRWAWRSTGSATGFAAVKSMALISRTATYDTFLANTRGGALYTLHIPTSAPMKPVVKLVRSRTWQGFDKLIANKCGQFGTVLLGIDKDTRTGHRYAVGRANGTATVINSLGPDGRSFKDPVYFRWGTSAYRDPLSGE